MGRKIGTKKGAVREQTKMQEEIIEEFGGGPIVEARKRLCLKCTRAFCTLLPLTTEGKDCPYFRLKEEEK